MAEIRNKYMLGDRKWCIFDFKPRCGVIEGMYVENGLIFYVLAPFLKCGITYKECELFDTKEEAERGGD